MLLAVSRVNESVPLFLVEGVKRRLGDRCAAARSPCSGSRSRRDTDDERDSLSHKLIRLLERELADVAVHDPHVADADRVARGRACADADAVVVATNHPEFCTARALRRDRRARDARRLVVDPWNCCGAGQVFALRRRGRRARSRRSE